MTHAVAGKPQDVLFLMVSGCPCPHCSNVLHGLTQLVHEGMIGRLEVVNVTMFPDRAEALGVDTVPWVRIGPFELEGMLSLAELREWLGRKDDEEGMAAYFEYLLASGRREKVVRIVRREPARMRSLIRLLGREKTTLHVRLGIGAVLEAGDGNRPLHRPRPGPSHDRWRRAGPRRRLLPVDVHARRLSRSLSHGLLRGHGQGRARDRPGGPGHPARGGRSLATVKSGIALTEPPPWAIIQIVRVIDALGL